MNDDEGLPEIPRNLRPDALYIDMFRSDRQHSSGNREVIQFYSPMLLNTELVEGRPRALVTL